MRHRRNYCQEREYLRIFTELLKKKGNFSLSIGEIVQIPEGKREKLEIMDHHEEGTIDNATGDGMDCFEEVFYQKVTQTNQEPFGFVFFKENLCVHFKKEMFLLLIIETRQNY